MCHQPRAQVLRWCNNFPFYYGLVNARGLVSPYVFKDGRCTRCKENLFVVANRDQLIDHIHHHRHNRESSAMYIPYTSKFEMHFWQQLLRQWKHYTMMCRYLRCHIALSICGTWSQFSRLGSAILCCACDFDVCIWVFVWGGVSENKLPFSSF